MCTILKKHNLYENKTIKTLSFSTDWCTWNSVIVYSWKQTQLLEITNNKPQTGLLRKLRTTEFPAYEPTPPRLRRLDKLGPLSSFTPCWTCSSGPLSRHPHSRFWRRKQKNFEDDDECCVDEERISASDHQVKRCFW